MKRAASIALAIVVATAGAIGILLALQSRDDGTLDRPATVRTTSTP